MLRRAGHSHPSRHPARNSGVLTMSRARPALRVEPLEDRLAPALAGTLNPAFGTGGVALLPPDLSPSAFPYAVVAPGPDGSVVVAGSIQTTASTVLNTDFV